MLKLFTPVLLQCICKLFNIIMGSSKYPYSWRENILKRLYKKGDDTDPSNYRGVAISSCLNKLFARVIYNRLETHINENKITNENLTGFRKSYRTSDHILTLKTLIDKACKRNSYVYSCFVDFKKAFDTVWRCGLFKKLSKMGIDGKMLQILENIYSEVNYSIKLHYSLTDPITSNVGLKQGCVLSPLLFNLYINDLPNMFNEFNDPVHVGKYLTNIIMYADDLVLLFIIKF